MPLAPRPISLKKVKTTILVCRSTVLGSNLGSRQITPYANNAVYSNSVDKIVNKHPKWACVEYSLSHRPHVR